MFGKQMKFRKLFTLFFVSMLFLSVSIGTVMAESDPEDKELVIKDSDGNVKKNTAAEPGQIPEIGNISGPSSTTDVTAGLGVFAKMGQFLMDYAIHIAVFIMVLAIVILSTRGSWARSNQKSEDAAESRTNTKGLIIDGIMTMAALMFVFFILAPFVKSFIPS